MRGAFLIAATNADKQRLKDNKYKDKMATSLTLKVGGSVLVRNSVETWRTRKDKSILKRGCIKLLNRKTGMA